MASVGLGGLVLYDSLRHDHKLFAVWHQPQATVVATGRMIGHRSGALPRHCTKRQTNDLYLVGTLNYYRIFNKNYIQIVELACCF
jgi:hypothetical protein